MGLAKRLLSIDETAELLGISKWTVRAWIQQGRLASVKLGSRRLLAQAEIDRVIEKASTPALPVASNGNGFHK